MTQPAGPPGPYQMPAPAPSSGTPTAKRPSAAGYWIGGGILVVGCGIAIVWFAVVIVGLVSAPDDFQRVAIPGTEVVTLDDGDWNIYYESRYGQGYGYGIPDVTVTGPSGRDVSLGYSDDTYTYDVGGHTGQTLYEFRAPTAGAYTIETSTVGEPGLASGDQIAIGRPPFGAGRIGGILGSLALGAASFIAGLVVLIVTIVRRSRAKRTSYATAYGPGPYGGGPPTPYGQPPYGGPPPYGQPPYGGPAPYGQPPYGQPPYGSPPPVSPPFGAPPQDAPGSAAPPAPSAWPSPSPDQPGPPPVAPAQPGWASPEPEATPPAPERPGWASPSTDGVPESEAEDAPPPPAPPPAPPAARPGPPPPGTSPWHPPDDRPPQS